MLRTSLIVATLASVSSPRPPATVFTVRSWGAERRRQVAGEPEKGALGAGVVVVGDNGVVYQVRDDADDPAAALLDHPRHDGLRAIQGTPGRAKLLQVVVPSEVREISASDGIELEVGQCVFHQYVHQNIHGAKSVCRRADHLAHRRLVGDAGGVGEVFTPPLSDVAGDLLCASFALEVINDHRGALFRQRSGDSHTDPTTRDGDERHLATENTHRFLPSPALPGSGSAGRRPALAPAPSQPLGSPVAIPHLM